MSGLHRGEIDERDLLVKADGKVWLLHLLAQYPLQIEALLPLPVEGKSILCASCGDEEGSPWMWSQ